MLGQPDSKQLISASSIQEVPNNDPNSLFSVKFGLTDSVMSYERSHYTLLHLIGDIGALYGALCSVGLTIVKQIFRVHDVA
jgi:hypothetical protein